MTYPTIKQALFIVTYIFLFLIVTGTAITIGLYSNLDWHPIFYMIVVLPTLYGAILLAQNFSTKKNGLIINDSSITINNINIPFESINKFHFNSEALWSISLEIELKSGLFYDAMLTTKIAKDVRRDFTNAIHSFNNEKSRVSEVSFSKMHKDLMKVLRPAAYIGIILVISINLYFLYTIFNPNIEPQYSLIFMNLTLIPILSYLKR